MNTKKTDRQPRVVKLSGGRSSGMMLLGLLKQNKLVAERGDVIIFNNTSAEHKHTYSFVRKLKNISEEKYGIPFFWLEYCTYEDMGQFGLYQRHPSYKLVNTRQFGRKNPDGYHCNGEVFEEMISHSGFLPNTFARSCTKSLKIFITNSFLADWWGGKLTTPRLGHFTNHSMIEDDDIIELHNMNNGETPPSVLLEKKKFVRNCPIIRKEQEYSKFTKAKVLRCFPYLQSHIVAGKAQLYGDYAINYVSYLGLRDDEKRRYERVRDRTKNIDNQNSISYSSQPHGETVTAPLVDDGTKKKDVIEFWRNQKFDLHKTLGSIYSNCVFCPLKGKKKLEYLAYRSIKNSDPTSPESIQWWMSIEEKYQRDLTKENRLPKKSGTKFVGFFGPAPEPVFERIRRSVSKDKPADYSKLVDSDDVSNTPCNCTD